MNISSKTWGREYRPKKRSEVPMQTLWSQKSEKVSLPFESYWDLKVPPNLSLIVPSPFESLLEFGS